MNKLIKLEYKIKQYNLNGSSTETEDPLIPKNTYFLAKFKYD